MQISTSSRSGPVRKRYSILGAQDLVDAAGHRAVRWNLFQAVGLDDLLPELAQEAARVASSSVEGDEADDVPQRPGSESMPRRKSGEAGRI